ncbi:MAG: ion transporter [Streptosporangiales bacterium]|nr:ion transporter [Streptosporangiales bacterium]
MISRAYAREVVESGRFQRLVLGVIFVNAVSLGLSTSPVLSDRYGIALRVVEIAVLVAFGLEMVLRLYAGGRTFFRDPWNWFDLIIVCLALLPMTSFFSVMRVLRVLRLARIVSVIPSLRRVIAALLSAVPGIGSIIVMLMVALYSGAILGVQLFRSVAPEYFGSLDRSLFTMFEIMTLENWPAIAEPIVQERAAAWVFFVGYIVITAFILLNLLIGVIVSAMEIEVNRNRWQEDQRLEKKQHEAVMTELRELRTMVAVLQDRVPSASAGPGTDTDGTPGRLGP